MCVSVYHLYTCVSGGQKNVLYPLQLELTAVVTPHVGAYNLVQLLWKSSNTPNTETYLQPLILI